MSGPETGPRATDASARFDVIVLGSGPAGQKAAVQAAKAGKRVRATI